MSSYKASRKAFDEYCWMSQDQEPTGAYAKIQVRLARWEQKNFGYQPSEYHALGIAEEVGELVEAIDTEKMFDAVGDIFVYAAQLATAHRLDFGTLLFSAPKGTITVMTSELTMAVGRLCHTVLKSKQKIRGYDDIEVTRQAVAHCLIRLISAVEAWSRHRFDYITAWMTVAHEVMQRDWKSNPTKGVTS